VHASFGELISSWSHDQAGTKAKWNAPVLVQRTNTGNNNGDVAPTRAAFVMSRPELSEARVHLIVKAAKVNAFPMGVTIGRVEGNDIAIDDSSVSRFHAWLQQDLRSKAWSLTDADSKNGTWVGGMELAGKQKVALSDGTEIRLGNVYLTFLMPEGLWALLLGDPLKK
jgi:hypothetical protein